jgi:archaellum biogenesis ATPase FlaH
VWLTTNKRVPNSISTINELKQLIHEFVTKSEKSVILVERLEYLIAHSSIQRILKMIYELNDLLADNDAIIILSVNPESLRERDVKALEQETKSVYGMVSKKIKLKEDELSILTYINQQNTKNKVVTYNEITRAFRITKPTTRTKIRHLEEKRLVRIQRAGRTKTITITALGRTII